jgi:hypothetical protein
MAEEQDIVVHYLDTVEVFDKDLQLTLADIRGHFGVTGGSLKVGGKVKVVKPDIVVSPGTYVLDIPQRNQAQQTPIPPTNTSTIPAVPQSSIEPKATPQSDQTKPDANKIEINQESNKPHTMPTNYDIATPQITKEPIQVIETKLPENTPITPTTKPDTPTLKREIENALNVETKKPKLSEHAQSQSPLSFGHTTVLPSKLTEHLETKPKLDPTASCLRFRKVDKKYKIRQKRKKTQPTTKKTSQIMIGKRR